MAVNDLHRRWSFGGPDEADTVLIVDPNAVLARTTPGKSRQPISWRHAQVLQPDSRVQLLQLAGGTSPEVLGTNLAGSFCVATVEDILAPRTPEGSDHHHTVAWLPCYVNSGRPTD